MTPLHQESELLQEAPRRALLVSHHPELCHLVTHGCREAGRHCFLAEHTATLYEGRPAVGMNGSVDVGRGPGAAALPRQSVSPPLCPESSSPYTLALADALSFSPLPCHFFLLSLGRGQPLHSRCSLGFSFVPVGPLLLCLAVLCPDLQICTF